MEFSPGMYLSDRRTVDPFHSQGCCCYSSDSLDWRIERKHCRYSRKMGILEEAAGCNQAGVLGTRPDEKTL